MNDLFNGHGVEIRLKNDEDFLKIKETLTRIGIASKRENKLFQTCHIFHKQGRYAIMHFKEMFLFDGKTSDFTEDDRARRNKIVDLLQEWNLFDVLDKSKIVTPKAQMNHIKIISHKEKTNWILESKYTVGSKR